MVANSAIPRRQPSEPELIGTSTARFRYLGGVRNHRRVRLCRGYWRVKSVLPIAWRRLPRCAKDERIEPESIAANAPTRGALPAAQQQVVRIKPALLNLKHSFLKRSNATHQARLTQAEALLPQRHASWSASSHRDPAGTGARPKDRRRCAQTVCVYLPTCHAFIVARALVV